MNTYTLKVTQMDCVGPDDTVITVHWAYTGTDGTTSAGYGGTTTVTRDPSAPFTPYNQLTEEQVVGWVLGTWSAEEKAAYETTIAEQMAKISPPLPWDATPADPDVT